MQLPNVFAAVMALTLAAPALAAPGLSPNNDLKPLSKRSVMCGINITEPEQCPDGFHCACSVVIPCPTFPCKPSTAFYCVKKGCNGCDCPEP